MKLFERSALLHATKPHRTTIHLGIAAAKLVCALCMPEDHQWNHPLFYELPYGFPLGYLLL